MEIEPRTSITRCFGAGIILPTTKLGGRCGSFLALLATSYATSAAQPALGDAAELPPPSSATIDFDRDIHPIIEKSCFRCHGRERPKSGFRLDSREAALKGGEHGVDIVIGDSAKSPLIHYVARIVDDLQMPPSGKGDPLIADQVAVLRAWIDQGAKWGTGTEALQQSVSITPTLRYVEVSGDVRKFRELNWTRAGWSGGLEDLELTDRRGDTDAILRAHVIADESNYGVSYTVRRPDTGFFRTGVESYRKYYDDAGGYSPLFSPAQFSLDRDLHLDIGKAWIDFGLTLPDWPRLTVGYEYQWKTGAKSLLQWGLVADNSNARNLAPAAKEIDERVHIVKVDADYTVAGWRLENNFRGEFYDLKTARTNTTLQFLPDPSINAGVTVREGQNSLTGANSFRAEKQFTDWLFASGGYLYSKLSADASFALDGQPSPFGGIEAWRSRQIVLERESHVVNLNNLLGPWEGFTLALGAQSEWTRQEGMTGLDIRIVSPFPSLTPVTINSDLDAVRVQESALLRFTSIPFTTLYAEARLEQESLSQFEEQAGLGGLLRDTDATSDGRDLRAGFSTSPWKAATWSGYYRRVERDSDYDHLRDLDNGSSAGYSAFIRSRRIATDQVETKLALRPASWLRATLSCKLESTEYHTGTDLVAGGASPGGVIEAGNYDAHIYGLNLSFTGIRNLYLNTTFTYQDVRTLTAQNGNPSVVPYRGDIYSVLTSANYTVNAKTELFASYSFSRAGFGRSNFADGLPTGIDYTQHTAQSGVTWRVNPRFKTRLGYGYYAYAEPTTGGLNDYTAHMVFTSMTYQIP